MDKINEQRQQQNNPKTQQQQSNNPDDQQQPYYTGQPPPPPPYGQQQGQTYYSHHEFNAPPYNQQMNPSTGTTTSTRPRGNIIFYDIVTVSPSPLIDKWIYWLCLVVIFFDLFVLIVLEENNGWDRYPELVTFACFGMIYHSIAGMFAKYPLRKTSIGIGCFGFLLAIFEFFILQLKLRYPPIICSYCWFGIVIGILYLIKGHKLIGYVKTKQVRELYRI